MTLQLLSLYIVLGLLLAAVATDLLTRRIPNALVVYGMLLGLSFHALAPAGQDIVPGSESGLFEGLLGGLVGLALFLPLHALRTLGAGDVKLLAMAGIWLGAQAVLLAALWTLVAGGLLSLVWAVASGQWRHVVRNFKHMVFATAASALARQRPAVARPVHPTGRLPYAVAIAAGSTFELARRWGAA
jgi:prepilin peptidase CpaA